jgi:hypothetical protein
MAQGESAFCKTAGSVSVIRAAISLSRDHYSFAAGGHGKIIPNSLFGALSRRVRASQFLQLRPPSSQSFIEASGRGQPKEMS